MSTLEAGSKAPSFNARVTGGDYADGDTVSTTSLRGHHVVLYFYPKDDTPGCTAQACALRDDWDTISAKAKVFGISTDSLASHAKFIKKHALPFPLLADEERKIVTAFGVWVEKSMYGKKYMGTERTTFILSSDGTIKAVLRKVQPAAHLAEVLKVLK